MRITSAKRDAVCASFPAALRARCDVDQRIQPCEREEIKVNHRALWDYSGKQGDSRIKQGDSRIKNALTVCVYVFVEVLGRRREAFVPGAKKRCNGKITLPCHCLPVVICSFMLFLVLPPQVPCY